VKARRRKKEEGRRKKEEGRGKREEGRRKKEEGRNNEPLWPLDTLEEENFPISPSPHLPISPSPQSPLPIREICQTEKIQKGSPFAI